MTTKGQTRTETATTAHGTVDYEVVECCSCANDTKKETAKRIVVGEIDNVKDWSALGKREYEFKTGTITDGYVCDYCANDPAGMPEGSIRDSLSQIDPVVLLVAGWILIVLLTILVVVL